ncbi:hypothetical protein JCM10213v2_005920 [Rhodosporidiobolus nylandii]
MISSILATAAASAPWATSTGGGMSAYNDEDNTIILHTDGNLNYTCPAGTKDADAWKAEGLTDALTAHTATGPGCKVQYTFKGDSIQIYGATASDAGVFGCSVDTSVMQYTNWWNAQGSANTFEPYKGSCIMQGIGYDTHLVEFENTAFEAKKIYFTGE